LSLSNTFTAYQTIASTVTATALDATSTHPDGCIVKIQGLAVDGDAELEMYSKGTGIVSLQAFRDAAAVGSLNFEADGDVSIYGEFGQLLFLNDVSSDITYLRTNGTTAYFKFQTAGGADNAEINVTSGKAELTTTEATLQLRGQASTILATTVGSVPEEHYKVADGGVHSADGEGYAGTLHPVVHVRSAGVINGSSITVTDVLGETVTVARIATYGAGGYRLTLGTAAPITYYIVHATVKEKLASGGTGERCIHAERISSTQFDVTISSGGGVMQDEDFYFSVLW
jgi:hypothetical protein